MKKLPAKKASSSKPKATAGSAVKLGKVGGDGGQFVVVHRSKLKDAPYNPRQISAAALRKLVESIRLSGGLIEPPTWNRRSGHVVGGHQRLKALDVIKGSQDYEVTVCMIDVSEAEEIELNIRLNSPDIRGEYDVPALLPLIEREDVDLAHLGMNMDTIFVLCEDAGVDIPDSFLAPEDRKSTEALQEENMEEKLGEALDEADAAEEAEADEAAILEHKRRKAAFAAQENFAMQHGTSFRVVFPSDATCQAFLNLLGGAYTGEYVDGMALAAEMSEEFGDLRKKLEDILKAERPKKLKDFTIDDIPKKKKKK